MSNAKLTAAQKIVMDFINEGGVVEGPCKGVWQFRGKMSADGRYIGVSVRTLNSLERKGLIEEDMDDNCYPIFVKA